MRYLYLMVLSVELLEDIEARLEVLDQKALRDQVFYISEAVRDYYLFSMTLVGVFYENR